MASLTILLIFLTTYLSGIGLIGMIVIPMCSSFISLKVNWKYRIVYLFACLITFFIDPSMTLFIVIPSLISGLILGELLSKYIQGYYIIFITTMVVSILQIGSTYLIDLLFEVNMIELFGTILKISNEDFISLFYLFIFILSLIQVSLSFIIITNELKKLNFEFNEKNNQFINIFVINCISIALSIAAFFINNTIYFLLLGFTIYFGVVLGYYNFSFYQKKKILIIQLPLYIISIIGFSILYNIIGNNNSLILLLLPFVSQLITSTYIIIYQLVIKKGQINQSLFDKLD